MSIKKQFIKLLVGPHALSDYIALGIPQSSEEAASWYMNGVHHTVTATYLLYDPAMLAVLFHKPLFESIDPGSKSMLELLDGSGKRLLTSFKLIYEGVVDFDDKPLHLFRASDADLKLKGIKQQLVSKLIYRKLQKNHKSFLSEFDPSKYRVLSGFFAHPRLVRLLTMKIEEQEMYFPIDLYTQGENNVLFGLRNSNKGTTHLKEGTRLCISDVRLQHQETIYSLGKFGGKAPDKLELEKSQNLGFHIPNIFNSYIEMEIEERLIYPQQRMYKCKILNRVALDDKSLLLAHIQLLRYLRAPLNYHHQVV